jgi:citrate lyase subunit beta/citryl-CoA lyase
MLAPIRSLLFVPGVREDRFDKAMSAGADAVTFDLEDSVEPAQKEHARTLIARFLSRPPASRALRLVRINPIRSATGEADLAFFREVEGYDGIVVPKMEDAAAAEQVVRVFEGGARGRQCPPLLLLLESPRAIVRAAEIAAAKAPVAALMFGAEDLTASMGMARTIDGEELIVPRSQIALAAAAADAQALDAVCTALDDPAVVRRDAERARALGFRGKMAIHPRQVPTINEVFTPSAVEIERARKVIAAFEAAQAAGEGVTRMDGQMIELPIVERARRVLDLAARVAP